MFAKGNATRLLQFLILFVFSRIRTVSASQSLTICLLVERGTNSLFYNFDRSAAAVDLALQYANDQILFSNNISLNLLDTNIGSTCSARNHIVNYAMDLMSRGVKCDVYIGPGCGSAAESLYDFTSAYRTLVIGCPAAGVGTSAALTEYPYFARISITHLNTATVLLQFLHQQNYTTPTIVQDQSNSFYQQMSLVVTDYLKKNDGDLYTASQLELIQSNNLTDDIIEKILVPDSENSRVFILLAPSNSVRQFMLVAHRLGMTGGDYIYFGVNLFPSTTWGNFSYSYGDAHDSDAQQAYQSLILATLSNGVQDSTYEIFAQAVKKLSVEKYNFNYSETDNVDIVTGHFYDSVIFYASMIKTLATAGVTSFNGDNLVRIKNGFTFTSPINGLVTLTSFGDRLSSYVLQNFNPNSGRFEDYVSYPAAGKPELLGTLFWPNGNQLPPNTPRCGFLGNDPKCAYKMPASSLAAAVAVPVIFTIVAVCAGVYFFRKYVAATTDPYWWRIFIHELSIIGPSSKSTASSGVMQSQLVNGGDTGTVVSGTKTEMSVSSIYALKKATYDGNLVGLTELHQPRLRVTNTLGKSLLPIKRIQHNNMQKFFGIAINDENLCEYVVGELCAKGTLTRLLERDRINLDWNFKSALMKDLTNGMTYLHSTNLISHGNLSSNTCLIDSNFVLKICDYGLEYFRLAIDLMPLIDEDDEANETRDLNLLFWRAPEHLRQVMPPEGTQKGDVYSYSIILQQIILRSPPFRSTEGNRNSLTDKDILLEVKKSTMPPLRPRMPISACPVELRDLMDQCWEENPLNRPIFPRIRENLLKILKKSGDNIVDHLIRSMEKHAAFLEHEAEQKMKEFMEEKRRSEDILSQILPKAVAAALTNGQIILPETYPSTTVHFSDIEGFSELVAEAKSPIDIIYIMNTLYSTCDAVIEKYDVYKVETNRDQLMIVSGLPVRNGIKHAGEIATMGLSLRREVSNINLSEIKLKLRVGIHSGSCVAGVIGTKMPRYCLFGDTVNTSSRMESHGEPGKIQCSPTTRELLEKLGGYVLVPRGEINVKGKGMMETYWLVGKDTG